MSAKHTPGPWAVYGEAGQHVRTEAGLSEFRVYKIGHQADAALIAAAPDLLAALKHAETALYDAMHAGNLSSEYAGGAIKVVNAAIEKAEGRARG